MIQTVASHWDTRALESRSEKAVILYRDDSSYEDTLENIRENIANNEGQFISLDLAEPLTESLSEIFHAALNNVRWDQSLQFSLPTILQHNPRVASPFINRAILWQRLCDLLIIDDAPYRATVLVLENIDLASPGIQREVVRLIQFHETHSICRTFIFTLNRYSRGQIISELRDIIGHL